MASSITIAGIAALPKVDCSPFQEGDLFLCSGSDWVSRAIEDATDSPFSHVGVLSFDARAQQWEVIEAFPPRVRAVPVQWYLSNFNGGGDPYAGSIVIARWAGILPTQAATTVAFMLTQLGIGYGDWTIADIAARLIDHELPPVDPTGKTWICSQLVQAAYCQAGMTIPNDSDGFCDPGDIWSMPPVQPVGALLNNQ